MHSLTLLAGVNSSTVEKHNPDVPPQSTDQVPQMWDLPKTRLSDLMASKAWPFSPRRYT
ncbi:hypothetical protein EMIT0196MI5_10663 [Pseudomonas sp. IT-196MI5]